MFVILEPVGYHKEYMMKRLLNNVWYSVFDAAEDEAAAAKKKADEDTAAKKKAEEDEALRNQFSQEDVNRFLAEDRRKNEAKFKKVTLELDTLRSKATLTTDERKRIEALQNEILTTEELYKREQEKIANAHQEELTAAKDAVETWRNRFTESTILRTITDAAVVNNAFSPDHITAILRPNTRLIEVVDSENKPTGKYNAKVKFATLDSKGKPVTLDLSVGDAVKQMSEMEQHLNLFKGKGAGGVGKNNAGGGNTELADAAELAKTDPLAYIKARKEGKIKL